MAFNANKAYFLRGLTKRGFSAQACPRSVGEIADVKSNKLPNKIVVAYAEGSLPIARVSVIFRAGSRNESYDTLGASHIMRLCAGLSTMRSTGFAITRNIQQIGGSLTASSDREILTYTVETTVDQIQKGLCYLQDVVSPAFKPWEISDNIPRLKTQVQAVPPQVRAVELMHQAAFRKGLGNSVYCPKHQIGKISSESLLLYASKNCTSDRCAVVGVGVDPDTLVGFAQSLELPSEAGNTDPTKYYGGNARKDTEGNLTHVAVCGSGGTLANPKEALAFAVLQQAAGVGSHVKRGNVNGYLACAAFSAAKNAPISFAALNACYTDGGVFGFVLSAESRDAGMAVEAASKALKSGTVSEEDIKRGKALLKAAVIERYAVDGNILEEIGGQAALLGEVRSAETILKDIDSVSSADVQKAAKKAGSGKLSLGAVGNLAHIPYASDLS